VATRAILFDLGNTLVGYYTSSEFPVVLRRCLRECARALGHTEDPGREEDLFARAVLLESSVPKSRPDHLTIPNLAGIIALLAEAS
jgi:hypothetical protein